MKKLALVSVTALILAACGGTPQACTDMLKNYDDIIAKADNEMLKDQFTQQRAALEEALKSAGSEAEAQCVKANEGFEQLKKMMESAAAPVASEAVAPEVLAEPVAPEASAQ